MWGLIRLNPQTNPSHFNMFCLIWGLIRLYPQTNPSHFNMFCLHSHTSFKTRLLERGFHALISNASFPSPTDVGSYKTIPTNKPESFPSPTDVRSYKTIPTNKPESFPSPTDVGSYKTIPTNKPDPSTRERFPHPYK